MPPARLLVEELGGAAIPGCGIDDPEFWNPGIRAPICLNAPAARTYLPRTIAKTRLALAGKSKAQIAEALRTALDKGELPPRKSAPCAT